MAMAINKAATIFASLLFFSFVFLSLASDHRFHPLQQQGRRPGRWGSEEASPFHFNRRSFRTLFESSEGTAKVLRPFTERLRWLFRGIRNYRFGFMVIEPNMYTVPHHSDACFVILILRGRGVITFVTQDTIESFHVEEGQVARIPTGVTHYFTNTDNTQQLKIAKIIVPINIPGRFENFYVAESEGQLSYLRSFSNEVLTASFNVTEEQLEQLFEVRRRQKVFRRASPEQIKELSQHAKSSKDKRASRRWVPFSLRNQEPIYSNEYGQFREARPDKFKQLEDIDIFVACLNMTEGSILMPHYNSEATVVVFVNSGCVRVEMACPHISMQQWQREREGEEWKEETEGGSSEEMSGKIHRIVSDVCEDEVFVVMPGHPIALTAIGQQVTAVGFGINARNNQRNFFAGKENMINRIEIGTRKSTFGVEEEVAKKVFTSQGNSFFTTTKLSQQGRETGPSFQSILNLVGY